ASARSLHGTPGDADTGVLSLKITATDQEGLAVSSAFSVAIDNINEAPVLVNALADQSAENGSPFSFVIPANTFADPDAGDTLSYTATLGNGGALPAWLS